MTAMDYSKTCGLFCPYFRILQCYHTHESLGYLPSLMAPSAKHRSHFFPSSFSDMLNISLCQARSVKCSSLVMLSRAVGDYFDLCHRGTTSGKQQKALFPQEFFYMLVYRLDVVNTLYEKKHTYCQRKFDCTWSHERSITPVFQTLRVALHPQLNVAIQRWKLEWSKQ